MTHKEEMFMEGQILVPFNSHNRLSDIISVIEKAAKPGMKIVFLVRYPTNIWEWLRDHWVTTESSKGATLAGRKIMDKYSIEGQRALAEKIVAPWLHALEKIEVKATVDVYTGSLSSVLENYSRRDGISLLIRPRKDLSMLGFLRRPTGFDLKTA
jgi:hypothetical protein